VTVNIDPLNPFPSTGKIIINSVNYWTRDITNNSKIFNISVTLQCNSVSGTLSNINCDIVESVDVQTTVSVTVTNVVAAETSNALAFSMSPVLNPPTVEPQGSFTI
jgi:flavin reductase (DIM6/NTAB) family NADH-FMN oxidoreductase RutF